MPNLPRIDNTPLNAGAQNGEDEYRTCLHVDSDQEKNQKIKVDRKKENEKKEKKRMSCRVEVNKGI